MGILELRREYHRCICKEIVRIEKDPRHGIEYPNFSDPDSKSSVPIAWGVASRIGCQCTGTPIAQLKTPDLFKLATRDFVEKGLELLRHLRPGAWKYFTTLTEISQLEGYEHLRGLTRTLGEEKSSHSEVGIDYIVTPDIAICRSAITDAEVNIRETVVKEGDAVATRTPLRAGNRKRPLLLLHASISCKWTIRSDRSQNTRTEALNLIRNRKGHLPHIVAVTAEPLPTRIAALALGTGDLDCVYHFALSELKETVQEIDNQDQADMLQVLMDGRRLRDISDLPFDLAV